MFTGLIEKTGMLRAVEKNAGSGQIRLEAEFRDPPPAIGESISVQGVCLTLARLDGPTLSFDVLEETFERSNLGQKRTGDRLNLERAVRAGGSLGGHFVTGHVDGVGRVRTLKRVGRDRAIEIACDKDVLGDMVRKGSIACDGVSLTIVELGDSSFTVHIIPHTWNVTSFSQLKVGDAVNLETDILGKYVRRILSEGSSNRGVTWDSLRDAGFVG